MDIFILDSLVKGIVDGRYSPGDRFPSDNELSVEFGVPRIVVRNAFSRLEEMGYVVSHKGKGRFLRERKRVINLNLTGAESFTDKIRASGIPLVTRVIRSEIDTNGKASHALGCEPDEALWRTDRLRLVDGVPVALHISWVRVRLFPELAENGWNTESLFAWFRSRGHTDFGSSASTLGITLPTFTEQELFGCPPLVPLLILESDTLDLKTGIPLQYTRILYRSDCFKYTI
jgi:GntR family transcriptional regulator